MMYRRSVMAVVAMCGLAGSAIAQDQPDRTKTRPDAQQPDRTKETKRVEETKRSESEINRSTYALVPSSRLEGVTVIGADDVRLGMVKDTIVRGNSGRAVYVLVTRGMTPAYDQAPQRVVAVPFAALQWDDEKRTMSTTTTETKFNAATSMELDKWNTLREPTIAMNTYKYFEVPDDRFEADRRIYRINRDRTLERRDDLRDRNNDGKIDDKDRDLKEKDLKDQDKIKDKDKMKDKPDAPARRDLDDKNLARTDVEGSLFRVSEIKNKPLLSHDGQELGLVNDIVFDAPSGHVAFLVITPAANLNAGEGRIGVPWPMFEVDQTGRLYAHDLDKEVLRASPRLVQNDWGELKIENYNDEMYKRFGYPAPQWERTTVKSTTTTTTRTNTPTTTTPTKPGDATMQGDWRGPYTKAMATGTPRTVKGRIESISESSTEPKVVIINVKTDEGEVVPIHVAPRSWLDAQSLKLKQGETVSVNGKDIQMDGKKCTCAREVSAGGDRIVIYTDK